jgi:hypothetical protein
VISDVTVMEVLTRRRTVISDVTVMEEIVLIMLLVGSWFVL